MNTIHLECLFKFTLLNFLYCSDWDFSDLNGNYLTYFSDKFFTFLLSLFTTEVVIISVFVNDQCCY